jgi:Putative Ig domain
MSARRHRASLRRFPTTSRRPRGLRLLGLALALAATALFGVGSDPTADAQPAVSAAPTVALADGPTTPILDDFNRPNEDPLSQGGAWSPLDPRGSCCGPHVLSVVSNAAENIRTTSGGAISYRNQAFPLVDLELYATVAAKPSDGRSVAIIFSLREEGGATSWDGYYLGWQANAGVDTFDIHRCENNTTCTTVGGPVPLEMSAGDKLMVRRIGPVIEGWVFQSGTWSRQISIEDPAGWTGAKAGLHISGGSGARLDDFGGGAYDTGAPTTPVLDDYNRADEDPVSQGGQWAPNDPRGGCCADLQRVISNQATARNAANTISYRTTGYTGDLEAYFTIATKPADGGAVAVVFNIQQEGSTGWDGYFLTWDARSDTDTLRFEKIINNGLPQPDLAITTLEMNAGDKLMARRVGSTMEAWVFQGGTWTRKLTATDGTMIGGKIGALVRGQTTRIDDFGGGGLAGPTPPSTILDDFNRANEVPLSQSGQWASNDPRGGCCSDVLQVVSNQAAASNVANDISYRTLGYAGDIQVFTTIAAKPADGGAIALVFNIQQEGSTGWDGYFLTWDALSGTDTLRFEKIINNLVAGPNLAITNLEMSSGNQLMVRRLGNQMEAWVQQGGTWSLKLTATDSTLAGGKIGALMRGTNTRIDDYGAGAPGTFPPPPSGPPPPDAPLSALLDDFNRSDEDPLSQGGQWAPNDPRGTCCTDTLRVNSNQTMVRSSGDNISYRTFGYPSDVEVFATVTSKPGDGGGVALLFNLKQEGSSGWDGYFLAWDALSGTDTLRFRKIVNGVPGPDLASTNLEFSSGDKLLVRRIGNEMRAYVRQGGGWTLKLTATDSTLSGGKIGAVLRDSNARLDDFGGGFPVGSEPPPPVEITTTSLPGGPVGVAYDATLAATGGSPPYTWSRTSGSLPAGLTLNSSTGAISGTPTSTGTSSFTVRVDSGPESDTQALSITIFDPNAPDPPLLDNFNRSSENPVRQGGQWGHAGIHGGSGAQLSNNRLQSFAQPGMSYRVIEYDPDMTAAARIASTPSSSNHWLSVFIALQDAGSSGWDGYELRATRISGPDLWQIREVANGSPTVLASTTFDVVSGTMLLRRVGDALEFWWRTSSGTWSKRLTVADTTYTSGRIGVGGLSSGALDDFAGGGAFSEVLLDKFAPELRYKNDETYRADSAAIATDLWFPEPYRTVQLKHIGSDEAYAAADPSSDLDDLSLDYLGSQAFPHDYLSQPNWYPDDEAQAALDYTQWVSQHPEHRRRAYSRVVVDPNGSGHKLLQYWFFYYYNPYDPWAGLGNHEGDWEWAQIRVDATHTPVSMAVSQHGAGESCVWGPAIEFSALGRPVLYVAHESHANYFWAGTHPRDHLPDDHTYDHGAQYYEVPRVEDLTGDIPRWILWDGYWGDSNGPDFGSPRSPGVQDAWTDPWEWGRKAELAGCKPRSSFSAVSSDSAEGGRSQAAPDLPRIRSARLVRATHRGTSYRAVRVSYCFRSLPPNPARRPARLHLAVENLRDNLPPLSVGWRITRRCGVVTHPVGPIKPPYLLRISVESRSGTLSRQVSRRLK